MAAKQSIKISKTCKSFFALYVFNADYSMIALNLKGIPKSELHWSCSNNVNVLYWSMPLHHNVKILTTASFKDQIDEVCKINVRKCYFTHPPFWRHEKKKFTNMPNVVYKNNLFILRSFYKILYAPKMISICEICFVPK